ncbi:cation diffusion facilitator family transporter [Elusimicrobiota bacterium]
MKEITEKKSKLGYTEGLLSIVLNTLLFILKLWAGITAGSVAMIADAWHTFSDSITSLVVIIGFWISDKKADEEHPFGHGRAEIIGGIIVASFLFLISFSFFKESIIRLGNNQSLKYSFASIIIFAVSVIVKEGLAQFSIWAGRKIDSHSLIADGWHHRSDSIVSGLIIAGILLSKNFWWIDGVLGIIVSLVIFYIAFGILRKASSILLGEKVDPALEEEVIKLIRRISPEVSRIHHFHVHKYGVHTELTFHICLQADVKLDAAHNTATRLEEIIRKELKIEPTIHIEPCS